ncbi:divalent-cation tolerance protein CutA [Micromonospora chersina]|uniref:divalent-cation tolerance protein CutA n=1 Tax=Micromonospora chersina TaxID=47854 RepID=UPI0037B655F5
MPAPDETVGRVHRWRPARIVAWHESRPRPGVGGRPEGEQATPAGYAFLSVSTATETKEAAVELARLAVQARLAAGAQITGPVTSAFWHLGEFGTGEEWRLVLQTHVERYEDLENLLISNHPWKKPEVAAVPLVTGSADYFKWVVDTLGLEAS